MTSPIRSPRIIARLLRTSALCAALLSVPVSPSAQGIVLENHPNRLFQFETANMHPTGTLELNVGTMQTDPSGSVGTGNQLYFGGGSFAPSDNLTFGFDTSYYQDPTAKPILGMNPDFQVFPAALWGKVRLYQDDKVSVAAQASVETFVKLDSPIFGGAQSGVVFGSLKLPVTYSVSSQLQFHLTPGVSVFPDMVGGVPFYGTIGTIGAGVSYKPSDRLAFYGAVDVPFGDGGNTISNTATYVKQAVYTVGGRYNVTPKVALDFYVTNGVGTTPATSILTHWPDGDTVLAGLQLVYTPGARRPESYRGVPAPLTARQAALQQDGFTLGSPDMPEPGVFAAKGWYGSDENYGIALAFSPDRDFEANVIVEDYADDGSVPAALRPTSEPRYMIGPKLRFMDQNNGNPFSLSARVLFGRQIDSGVQLLGVFFAEGMASYKVNDQVTISANPKVAAFGNIEVAGLGLGVNFEVFDGLDLVAEATPITGDATTATWAVGARYNVPGAGLSVDANASNAIGRYGIGTMIAQDSVKYSISLTKRFDASGWR